MNSSSFLSNSSAHMSAASIPWYSSRSTSSTFSEFQAAISMMFFHYVNFITWSSSKCSAPKDACWSTAVCLLAEKICLHGTKEAWHGRILSAIWARVGYSWVWSCNWVRHDAQISENGVTYLPPFNDVHVLCNVCRYLLQVLPQLWCPSFFIVLSDMAKMELMEFQDYRLRSGWGSCCSWVCRWGWQGCGFSLWSRPVVSLHLLQHQDGKSVKWWGSHTVASTILLASSCQFFACLLPALISFVCSSAPPHAISM